MQMPIGQAAAKSADDPHLLAWRGV